MPFYSYLLSDLPGIEHAFLNIEESRCFDSDISVGVHQLHGPEVFCFNDSSLISFANQTKADAIFTPVQGIPIKIVTADCIPLLLSSIDGQYVAVIHAGWRGIISGVIQNCLHQFNVNNTSSGDIIVAGGPHIMPCCYEVSSDFVTLLLSSDMVKKIEKDHIELFFRLMKSFNHSKLGQFTKKRSVSSSYFDISLFCKMILISEGIPEENIDFVNKCTYCSHENLGSYRRRTHFPAPKTYQYSWIRKIPS
ncbi:polyphenol oxidase family protein [Serratia fonticola]|uniref:polyphenol oxidase family protein n=1 Tax=Serratia fonticola TaxID=47917 RepID=UPI003BB4BA61